jgi:diadenylate cyclase
VRELLDTLRWVDGLDIFVVAYIIYRALLLIRGTRAVQVLVGLAALVLLFSFARLLELHTVSWMLEELSLYLALAVIVLFQEDIRRALAGVGDPLFGRGNAPDAVGAVHRIGRACFRLADQGHGALVVLERSAALEELRREAIPLDATLTVELLVAIFQPSTPIHDGAVVVRNDRVWVAGAFLPLTKREDVPRQYGTRHRAALGQTQITDCMVFTVSEERRAVTIAFRGEFYPVDSPDVLRLEVQRLLSLDEQQQAEESASILQTATLTPVKGPLVAPVDDPEEPS